MYVIGRSERKWVQKAPRSVNKIHELKRKMVAWDSEGFTYPGNLKQSTTLLGNSRGARLDIIEGVHPRMEDILAFLCAEKAVDPTARHIGFGLGYDMSMFMQTAEPAKLATLHAKGKVTIPAPGSNGYFLVRWVPRKWLQVTDYTDRDVPVRTRQRNMSMKIEDISASYDGGFVDAIHDTFGKGCDPRDCGYGCVPHLPQVLDGKKHRGETSGPWADPGFVQQYHAIELDMMKDLAERGRQNMWDAGFDVTSYAGPAVPARWKMGKAKSGSDPRRVDIKQYMDTGTYDIRSPDGQFSLGQCTRFSFSAGRFEQFMFGRFKQTIFGYDVNSAHPFGMVEQPAMAGRVWDFWTATEHDRFPPGLSSTSLNQYGLYHVRLAPPRLDNMFQGLAWMPQPLFHRSHDHTISFPDHVEGWFWGPDIMCLMIFANALGDEHGWGRVEFLHAWLPTNVDELPKPFGWMRDMYVQRQALKNENPPNPAQWAMKLALNSTYGLTCQTVGWDPDDPVKSIPPFHQLEWASWTTAHTRYMLFHAVMTNGLMPGQLVGFETDSVMTTVEMDVPLGRDLGQWSRKVYDEGYYIQNGIGMFHCIEDDKGRPCDVWEVKRRGMDADSFTLDRIKAWMEPLPALKQTERWEPLRVTDTRFMTFGACFPRGMNPLTMVKSAEKHCRWIPLDRDMHPATGKRQHLPEHCQECRDGFSPWDRPHKLVPFDPFNAYQPTAHLVPWIDHKDDLRRFEEAGLTRDEV